MQRILSILLSVLLFAALASEGLMLLSFKINQTQIIESRCINKTRPEKECKGKCFLSKIFKEKKERKDSGKHLQEAPQRLFLFSSFAPKTQTAPAIQEASVSFFIKKLVPQSFYQSVFHPPDFN